MIVSGTKVAGGALRRATSGPFLVRFLAILMTATGTLVAGCGSESATETPPDPDPTSPVEYAVSPDSLIHEYLAAYNERESALIDSLFAPGFEYHFATNEVAAFDIPPTWNKQSEMSSMRRLFDGSTGVWPDGTEHPPANEFPFGCTLTPAKGSEWIQDESAGTSRRQFDVMMIVNLINFDVHFVGGSAIIEALDMSTVGAPGGESAVGFALSSWTDLGIAGQPVTGASAVHLSSWGFIRAVYRASGL